MATISSLKTSITQMAMEEAFDLIKETRFQRRQRPVKKTKAKTAKVQKPLNVNVLTKDQKLKLLKELEGLL